MKFEFFYIFLPMSLSLGMSLDVSLDIAKRNASLGGIPVSSSSTQSLIT